MALVLPFSPSKVSSPEGKVALRSLLSCSLAISGDYLLFTNPYNTKSAVISDQVTTRSISMKYFNGISDTISLRFYFSFPAFHPKTVIGLEDNFFADDEFDLILIYGAWIKRRTVNDKQTWLLRKVRLNSDNSISYNQLNGSLSEIIDGLPSIYNPSQAVAVKEIMKDFESKAPFATLLTWRHTPPSPSSGVCYDVVRLSDTAFYLIGTMTITRDTESSFDHTDIIMPVQSKILQYLKTKKHELYPVLL